MPPLPGEERLLTTYADVHYYFATPSPHPRQHRFDKASYLYIYHDGAQRKSRIEIANYPGTPDLDAFCGSLETVHLRNSDKFPTLCTLTVDGYRQSAPNSPAGQIHDPNDWRLPYLNPQDGSRSFLRLHTVDIYFWTLDDAKVFLATVQRLLAPGQLDIAQPAAREPPVNSVVQNLEHAAVSDPNYRHSQIKTPGSESAQQSAAPAPQRPTPSTAPVPLGQKLPTPEPVSPLETPAQPVSKPPETETTQSYAPMAYNPAAPAAPEPVKPREKTPPPPDAAAGTGLSDTTIMSHGGYSSGPPPTQPTPPLPTGQGYGAQPGGHPGYSSPPPNTGLTQNTQAPQTTAQPNPAGSLSFSPPPTTTPTAPPTSGSGQPGTVPYSPPPQDPNVQMYGQQNWGQQPMQGQYNQAQHGQYGNQPGTPGTPQPQPQQQPPPPMGGYSDFSYGQPQQQQQAAQGQPYNVHNQVYRPTEGEHMANYQQNHPPGPGGPGGPGGPNRPGKITENAMRVEKGVNKLFKKLEKKI